MFSGSSEWKAGCEEGEWEVKVHCGNEKKREAKEVPKHNSYISSKSGGKALPARASLEFLPFATGGSEATRFNVGVDSSLLQFYTRRNKF